MNPEMSKVYELTFDSCTMIDLLEDREPKERVQAARTLKQWAEEGRVRIYNGEVDEPLIKSQDAGELVGIQKQPNLTRLGEWILGVSVLASEEDARLDKEILELFSGVDAELPEEAKNKDRDRYLLTTHAHFGHDIFVTGDEKHILKQHDTLKELGIVVMSPQETVEFLRTKLFPDSEA